MAAFLALAAVAIAQVGITQVSVGNVSTDGFTAVWRTSALSHPGIDVYADAGGTTSLAGTARIEFFPVGLGDVEAASTFDSRVLRRDLQDLVAARLMVVVRVSGLGSNSTVHFRPRSYDNTGADNGSGLLPLTAVTTGRFAGFILHHRQLAVRFAGFSSEGVVALLHGPAGTLPLAAVVGDGAEADVALFPLGHILDAATGTNAVLAAPTPVTITVLGTGTPAGAFVHTVNFASTFGVADYALFEAAATSPAPVFTTHPANRTVQAGQLATFHAEALGDPAPGYQWQRRPAGSGTWSDLANDATYSGVATATLTVSGTVVGMTGDQFHCVASNGVPPAATSEAATLNVTAGTSSVALSNLTHVYDGTPKSATATTTPPGLAVSITYNGGATPPTAAGSYDVVATITEPGYEGAAAGTLVIARAGQTINFAELAGRTFGEAPFDVAATASSGLPVAFAVVSGPATIFVDAVTLTGAGVVTVRATQAGDANYSAAPPVERSFAVAKGTAGILLTNLFHRYGAIPRQAMATTTPLGMNVTFTYNGSATAPVAAGSYEVVATVVNPDYQGTASGLLLIEKAPLLARADHKTKTQGSPNPDLTITYIGLLGGQAIGVLDSLSVATTEAVLESPAGNYLITVSGGSDDNYDFVRQNGTLTITPPEGVLPAINVQPHSVTVALGAPTSFSVQASGAGTLLYQWYKNGAAIAGQTGPALSFAAVGLGDVGSYAVLVSNDFGYAVSAIASLNVTLPPQVPTITDEPDDLLLRRGARARFAVTSSGDTPLSYQWRKEGVSIPGATGRIHTIENVRPSDAGLYSVVVTNTAGSDTSRDARLVVAGRSWRGTYFGQFSSDGGSFAFYIRDDNTGVFCGFARGSRIPLFSREIVVGEDGHFTFVARPSRDFGLALRADNTPYDIDLTIADDGAVSGSVAGLGLTATGSASPTAGPSSGFAGFYQSGAPNSGDISYTIVGTNGEAYILAVVDSTVDAGVGSVDAAGNVAITTENNASVDGTLDAQSGTLSATVTPPGGTGVGFIGANSDTRQTFENLVNISTRGVSASGDGIIIAGFVITGSQPKPVLIRGIGPALTDFGVPGALEAVQLDLFHGSEKITTAGDWGAATNAAEIAAAATRVGAFALSPISRDSAILITLQPGVYSVHLSGQNGLPGVSLVEVYDASEGDMQAADRLVNISTRGFVGTADNVQMAGFVILGDVPKRVLIRGVGPTLADYGVPGTLADPIITLFDVTGTAIVSNDTWGVGNDAAQISEAAARVGAFPLAAGSTEAVLLLNLQPGVYTVHLSGKGGTTGIAMIEVYDVP